MQSNEEKFQQKKVFLEKARTQLLKLQAEAMMLDIDDAELKLSQCQTELSATKILHETLGARQFRRVPHGVIPDMPITHRSIC